mmetsp:Transcript_16147/g.33013  ORF Transcript_16147/g.33013 Transcript_16147/m.33013 type:complete len:212 (-) Transcript_16147:528-1163(-)
MLVIYRKLSCPPSLFLLCNIKGFSAPHCLDAPSKSFSLQETCSTCSYFRRLERHVQQRHECSSEEEPERQRCRRGRIGVRRRAALLRRVEPPRHERSVRAVRGRVCVRGHAVRVELRGERGPRGALEPSGGGLAPNLSVLHRRLGRRRLRGRRPVARGEPREAATLHPGLLHVPGGPLVGLARVGFRRPRTRAPETRRSGAGLVERGLEGH